MYASVPASASQELRDHLRRKGNAFKLSTEDVSGFSSLTMGDKQPCCLEGHYAASKVLRNFLLEVVYSRLNAVFGIL